MKLIKIARRVTETFVVKPQAGAELTAVKVVKAGDGTTRQEYTALGDHDIELTFTRDE